MLEKEISIIERGSNIVNLGCEAMMAWKTLRTAVLAIPSTNTDMLVLTKLSCTCVSSGLLQLWIERGYRYCRYCGGQL